jgi:cytochrome b subunit of formate dehydrogenase
MIDARRKWMKKTAGWVIPILLTLTLFSLAYAASDEDCMECHSDKQLTTKVGGKVLSLFVDLQKYSKSVHGQVGCAGCHPDADVVEFPHPENLKPVNCGSCHGDADKEFTTSIHGKALAKNEPYAPTCVECHGNHFIFSNKDPRSLTYKMNIPALCGKCHKEGAPVARMYDISEKNILDNYSESIHGVGLLKKGLLVTAACSDCHGNHLILPHTDVKSTTSPRNIAHSCMVCHANIEQVHAKVIQGELWEKKPGAIPACSDCHRSHKIQKDALTTGLADNDCLQCHARESVHKVVGGKNVSLQIMVKELQGSAHKNIPCVKCHADVSPTHVRPCDTVGKVNCASCHAEIGKEYVESAHGRAHALNNKDAPSCKDCHGAHNVLPSKNTKSTTYRGNIPQLCGECHGVKGKAAGFSTVQDTNVVVDYATSVHGAALQKKGLLLTAVCTDCHAKHLILSHKDEHSSINAKNISNTCGICHVGIYKQFVTSIHSPTVSKSGKDLPTCEDCHSSHKIKRVEQDKFMTEVTDQCGRCHQDLAKTYFDTAHGKSYLLGNKKAAKCSDCHGAHAILPVNNPNSTVGFKNVVQTCRQCHPGVNRRFTDYLSHATHHDRVKFPVLYYTFMFMSALLIGTFGFFGLHTLLWIPRSFVRMREKKRKFEADALKDHRYVERFNNYHRISHIILIISFIGLAVTGMVLKFSDMAWARFIANMLGGAVAAGIIHRISAVVMWGLLFSHVYYLMRMKIRNKTPLKEFMFGKGSMLPNVQDGRDFIATLKWFSGKGPRPQYGRWTYWEKFDYLAVFWGVPVIGLSGMILWFPEISSLVFPGWLVNVAAIIHSDEALLATGFIFTVHFFNTHLRPEAFPMDPVIFTGVVPEEECHEERPRSYQEAKAEGRLEEKLVSRDLTPGFLKFVYTFGFLFLFIGLSVVLLIIYTVLFG